MPGTRLLRILFEVLRFALADVARKLHLSRSHGPASEELCLSLARLGTTFIKCGQALSLRRDLLPDDYVRALQSLQDHIAPFPPEIAMREIERSLGRPIDELFAEFDPKPLAAASVAQVHAARLNDGREVIAKVRRPESKVQIEGDMRALTWLARMATSVMPRLGHYRPFAIIDEIWTNLRKEIDFRREAQNIRRLPLQIGRGGTVVHPAPRPCDHPVGRPVNVVGRPSPFAPDVLGGNRSPRTKQALC